jgi:GTP cyclohydrolase I
MIVLSGIEFASTCEHHMLPFTGTATVGYIPNGKVVGLSKLARLTDMYARRLQIQERLTNQIAEALQEHTNALGVGVIIQAHHTCMSLRGIRKGNTTMTTTRLMGMMYDDPRTRAEFLSYNG